ncbi:unnamed protein product, partial [Symbiodinium pilosum]
VMSSACSGTGAPSFALLALLGDDGYVKQCASESNVAAARAWFLANHTVMHCYRDMTFARPAATRVVWILLACS